MPHLLTKTTYIRGRQCPKALYLCTNLRALVPPVDPRMQAMRDEE